MNTDRELMQHALDALEFIRRIEQLGMVTDGTAKKAITALRKRLAQPDPVPYWHSEFLKHNTTSGQPAQPKGCQCPACKIAPHASDCPVHNEPAWPNGLCDCGAQPEQKPVPVTDNTYNYAKNLAEAIFKQHFASDEHYSSGRIVWGVNDTVIGILTQIDNMIADMVRRPAQQQEPVAHTLNCVCGAVWDVSPDGVEEMVHAPNPPQRKPLTDEEIMNLCASKWASHPIEVARVIEAAHGIGEKPDAA